MVEALKIILVVLGIAQVVGAVGLFAASISAARLLKESQADLSNAGRRHNHAQEGNPTG